MKNNTKNKTKIFFSTLLTILISIFLVSMVVQAGTITPPSGTPAATFYTLSEIYNLIENNVTATAGSHDFTFSDSLTGTGHTLTEIYNALANLISPSNVKLGTTYLGQVGTYTGATTWSSSSYITSYDCSWLTTDPTQGSTPTLQTICGYNSGCTWNAGPSTCTGTPTGKMSITWYAATAACAHSTEGGLPAGTWRLPSESELLARFSDEIIIDSIPRVLRDDGDYWTNSTYADDPSNDYTASSTSWGVISDYDYKSYSGDYSGRCVH